MAHLPRLRVMLSSRSAATVFGGIPLHQVRERLKAALEALAWPDPGTRKRQAVPAGRLFEVYAFESDPGSGSERNIFEQCRAEIARSDLILVLYTGEAGTTLPSGSKGICHAELEAAINQRRACVSLINLLPLSSSGSATDRAFRDYIENLALWSVDVDSEEALHYEACRLLHKRVVELAQTGARAGAGKKDTGRALEWRQLDMHRRRLAMREALIEALTARPHPFADGEAVSHRIELAQALPVIVRVDAIPTAMGQAAGRELVGQPFLTDHRFAQHLDAVKSPGIVHVVACQGGVTEAQAQRLIGTPDAIAVSSDFGVYVADHVQNIQVVLLCRCSDPDAVQTAVQRFRYWLTANATATLMHRRAQARARILAIVAREATSIAGGA